MNNTKLFTQIEKSGTEATTSDHLLTNLYSWESSERYWTPRDRAWFVTYSFFFVVVIALAAILGQYILILAIIAFTFLWFVQASIPPEIVKHTINPLGIKTYGKLYRWKDISHYWFSSKHGIKYLNLDLFDQENPQSDRRKRVTLLLENNEDLELFYLMIYRIDYGDKSEIGYNFLTKLIYGNYIDIFNYLPVETPTQEEFLELEKAKGKATDKTDLNQSIEKTVEEKNPAKQKPKQEKSSHDKKK